MPIEVHFWRCVRCFTAYEFPEKCEEHERRCLSDNTWYGGTPDSSDVSEKARYDDAEKP